MCDDITGEEKYQVTEWIKKIYNRQKNFIAI